MTGLLWAWILQAIWLDHALPPCCHVVSCSYCEFIDRAPPKNPHLSGGSTQMRCVCISLHARLRISCFLSTAAFATKKFEISELPTVCLAGSNVLTETLAANIS